MPSLLSFTREELRDFLKNQGRPAYLGDQLCDWVYKKGVYDYAPMTNLSKAVREELPSLLPLSLPKVFRRQDAKDGTIKLLLEMEDGSKVETVLMRYDYGNAVCVSSEVGCSMGCAFCASGLLKKERGLTAAEMVGQVLSVQKILSESKERVSHVVIMGTGEPFDNYEEVMHFIRIINDPKCLEIGARHITVSTCGLIPQIERFGKEGLQVNLAISLHAATQEKRARLMPVAGFYPLDKLMPALKNYIEESGRRLTVEYILLKDVNDSLEDAKALADLLRGMLCYVNLIPFNPVCEKSFERSPQIRVRAFKDALLKRGINATVRKEFGTDIDAACGQLRAKENKK